MKSRPLLIVVIITVLAVAAILALTLALTPESANPAYAAAVDFMEAAGHGDDASAFALLTTDLQAYVTATCPDASVAACIDAYTPPEWGDLLSAVYRRSIPDGHAWDVLLIATYQEGEGFSGVCIYHRMQKGDDGVWRVAAWAGFLSCDQPEADIQRLRQSDAVNRAP